MKTKKINNIAIVIPTFNEADNIERLIKSIKNYISSEDKIIVVDDHSPDQTGEIVKKFSKNQKNIFILERKGKAGRGSAVFDGFRYLKKFSPDFYLEMDADFSHKPEDIPRLLKQMLKEKSDLIIGSRYLPKSKIFNWSIKRKIFSKFANIYAKSILQVPISDYTNGFRIYSKKAVDFLLSQKLESPGYFLLSETAYKLKKAGFKFSEIPIVFVNRRRGVSNLNFSEIKNAFLNIWKIRFS